MPLCKCGCGQNAKRLYVRGHNIKRGVGGDTKKRLMANIRVDKTSGCWNWLSTLDRKGYGEIRIKNGKSGGKKVFAHRLAYETFIGPIPEGMLVCHACDNPKCINPNHMFLGTYKDNYKDSEKKDRNCRGERNGQVILTEAQAKYIKYKSTGLGLTPLAEIFGVCISTISKIRCGKNWAWL